MNTAIGLSASENPYTRSFIKNRPRFRKSIRIDQKIDKSIASDRLVQKIEKQTSSDISSDHKLSFKSKIMEIGSGSGEIRLVEKSVTDGQTESADFESLSPKLTRSARYARFASNELEFFKNDNNLSTAT